MERRRKLGTWNRSDSLLRRQSMHTLMQNDSKRWGCNDNRCIYPIRVELSSYLTLTDFYCHQKRKFWNFPNLWSASGSQDFRKLQFWCVHRNQHQKIHLMSDTRAVPAKIDFKPDHPTIHYTYTQHTLWLHLGVRYGLATVAAVV